MQAQNASHVIGSILKFDLYLRINFSALNF